MGLPWLGLVVAPDAAMLLEQRAWILPRHALFAIGVLAGVRWRTDVDEHAALSVKGEPFGSVCPLDG